MSHALATVLRDGRRPSANRRRLRSELRPRPKEEAMSHALVTVLRDGRRPSATQRGFPRAGGHGDEDEENGRPRWAAGVN